VVLSSQLPQLIDAFTRLPRNAFHAVLLELADLQNEAQSMRIDAWQTHAEPAALLHYALTTTYDERRRSSLESMTFKLGAAVREGVVDTDAAAEAYTTAWAAAHAFVGDSELAEWLLMKRESLKPGERFPCLAATTETTQKSQLAATSACLLGTAKAEEDTAARTRWLLRLETLSAPSTTPGFDGILELLDSDTPFEPGAAIALHLCEIERILVTTDESVLRQLLRLLENLSDHVRDYRSRELLELRKIHVQSHVSREHALATLDELSQKNPRASLIEAAREILYLRSLEARDASVVAELALQRAREQSDVRFIAAWALRALTALRDSGADVETVTEHATALLERCSRLQRESPELYQTLQDFAVGATLGCGQREDAAALAAGEETAEYDTLQTLFWLEEAEIPWPAERELHVPLELRAFLASRAVRLPGLSLHTALFESWGDTDQGHVLAQYVRFFIFEEPEKVWASGLKRLKRTQEISTEEIWVLWAAARQLGVMGDFIDKMIPFQNSGTADSRLHCRAALADGFVELGNIEQAEQVLSEFADHEWADAIRQRFETRDEAEGEASDWAVMHEAREMMPDDGNMRDVVEASHQAIRQGQPRTAAKGFFEASRLASDAAVRGRMLFMSARSIEEADAFSARAIELYERALAADPQQSRALSRLLAIHGRREDWAVLIRKAKAEQKTPLRPDTRYLLEEAALQLEPTDPSLAYDGWQLALERVSMNDSLDDTLQRFERASQCALAADRIEDFDALIAGLRDRFDGTAFDNALFLAEQQHKKVRESLTDPTSAIFSSNFDPRVIRIASKRLLENMSHADVAERLQGLQPDGEASREALVEEIIFLIDASTLTPRERIERIESLEQESQNPWLGIAKANAFGELGDYEKAAEVLESSARRVESHLDRAEIYRQLGKLYEDQLINSEVALENYLVSFICDSGNGDTLALLEEMYSSRERFDDLVGAYDVAISHIAERNPSDLDESLLRAKRVHVLGNRLNNRKAAKEDVEWLIGRSSVPRETVNFILENLPDLFPDRIIGAWISRLDIELDELSNREPDRVANWYAQHRS
jgi:tetratricopeptide (TPR) repeat protein